MRCPECQGGQFEITVVHLSYQYEGINDPKHISCRVDRGQPKGDLSIKCCNCGKEISTDSVSVIWN